MRKADCIEESMRFDFVNRVPHIEAEPAGGGGSILARGYANARRMNGLPAEKTS